MGDEVIRGIISRALVQIGKNRKDKVSSLHTKSSKVSSLRDRGSELLTNPSLGPNSCLHSLFFEIIRLCLRYLVTWESQG